MKKFGKEGHILIFVPLIVIVSVFVLMFIVINLSSFTENNSNSDLELTSLCEFYGSATNVSYDPLSKTYNVGSNSIHEEILAHSCRNQTYKNNQGLN
jgi:hypothetical protein